MNLSPPGWFYFAFLRFETAHWDVWCVCARACVCTWKIYVMSGVFKNNNDRSVPRVWLHSLGDVYVQHVCIHFVIHINLGLLIYSSILIFVSVHNDNRSWGWSLTMHYNIVSLKLLSLSEFFKLYSIDRSALGDSFWRAVNSIRNNTGNKKKTSVRIELVWINWFHKFDIQRLTCWVKIRKWKLSVKVMSRYVYKKLQIVVNSEYT